jgi:hypothetical protein
MSTSHKDFVKPLNTTAPPDESTKTPTDKPLDMPLDPETKDWIHRLVDGMRVLATNEDERKRIAKQLF